jgi:hypothetical protein
MKKKNLIKENKGTVTVIKDSQLLENFPFTDEGEAQSIFLEQCRNYISNFDEYSRADIDGCLAQGKEIFGHGEIRIWWF